MRESLTSENCLRPKLISFSLQVSDMDLSLTCDGIFVLDLELLHSVSICIFCYSVDLYESKSSRMTLT